MDEERAAQIETARLLGYPLYGVDRIMIGPDDTPKTPSEDLFASALGEEKRKSIRHHSGNKYLRSIRPAVLGEGEPIFVDVYCVIKAFDVTGAGQQHALKKILCAGLRGKGDRMKDLNEAIDALRRAVDQEKEDAAG